MTVKLVNNTNRLLDRIFQSDIVKEAYDSFGLNDEIVVSFVSDKDVSDITGSMKKYCMKTGSKFYMNDTYDKIILPLDPNSGYSNLYNVVVSTSYLLSKLSAHYGKGCMARICAERINTAVNKFINIDCTDENIKYQYMIDLK